uniref:hypothetical protein n=1 Tax=Shewanella psychropiezotolerans TaxID=2593655 RepID=UPI001E38489C|nr:hypothetical protein [Shewanella psychropiezotolerans]
MPKVRHRVNSLSQEREEKMVNSRNCSHFDSFHEQIVEMYPDKKKLSLGQIGLCDAQQLLSVILLQQKSIPDTRFYVKIFESDCSAVERINLQLVALQTQNQECQESAHTDLGSRSGFDSNLESGSCVDKQAAIKQIIDAKLVAIPGCQRLILNQGRCLIDLYIGDILSSLSDTLAPADPASYIHAWLHTSDQHSLDERTIWQMAKLSRNTALLSSSNMSQQQTNLAKIAGFLLANSFLNDSTPEKSALPRASAQLSDEISQQERRALRQAQANGFQHYPQLPAKEGTIAVIGGVLPVLILRYPLRSEIKAYGFFVRMRLLANKLQATSKAQFIPCSLRIMAP